MARQARAYAFTDPVGPGTPAWGQYDKAVLALRRAGPKPQWGRGQAWGKQKAVKAFWNHRQEMIAQLRKHGAGDQVAAWDAQMDRDVTDPEFLNDFWPDGVDHAVEVQHETV